jgi:hypothetical protein
MLKSQVKKLVGLIPYAGSIMKLGYHYGCFLMELFAKQVAEERVIVIPVAFLIQWNNK